MPQLGIAQATAAANHGEAPAAPLSHHSHAIPHMLEWRMEPSHIFQLSTRNYWMPHLNVGSEDMQ